MHNGQMYGRLFTRFFSVTTVRS